MIGHIDWTPQIPDSVIIGNLWDVLEKTLRQEHIGPTVGRLKRLESLGRGREQICLVCSAALEAFGAAQTLSAPTEHAKSEEEGCQTSEPLGSLIGGVLANQRGVWEGRNTVCALVFYALRSVIPRFHGLQSWHETLCSGRINLCLFGNASLHVQYAAVFI